MLRRDGEDYQIIMEGLLALVRSASSSNLQVFRAMVSSKLSGSDASEVFCSWPIFGTRQKCFVRWARSRLQVAVQPAVEGWKGHRQGQGPGPLLHL